MGTVVRTLDTIVEEIRISHHVSVHSHFMKYKIAMGKKNFYINLFFPQRTLTVQSP